MSNRDAQNPGSIDNSDLFEIDANRSNLLKGSVMKLRSNLIRNQDYKMVNEHVWNLLFSLYSCKLIIVRPEKDIYAKMGAASSDLLDFEPPR